MKHSVMIQWGIVAAMICAACTPTPIQTCRFYTHESRLTIEKDGYVDWIEVRARGRDSSGVWEESRLINLRENARGSSSFSFDTIDTAIYTQMYWKIWNPDSTHLPHKEISDSSQRGFKLADTASYDITIYIFNPGDRNRTTYRNAVMELPRGWSKEDTVLSHYRLMYR